MMNHNSRPGSGSRQDPTRFVAEPRCASRAAGRGVPRLGVSGHGGTGGRWGVFARDGITLRLAAGRGWPRRRLRDAAVRAEDRSVSDAGFPPEDADGGPAWARDLRAVAVLTGAGISTDS